MPATKADIIAQLQKDILFLQGFRPILKSSAVDVVPGPVSDAFPNSFFPLGAVHEFLCAGAEDGAATGGFIAGVLSALMLNGGITFWISSSRTLFPPALKSFGIAPEKIIFIDLQKEKDILWVMEEALKCDSLAAVVGEIHQLSFTASRRLQLAVEQSQVTGFILRPGLRNPGTSACISRWKITCLPGMLAGDMPGVGFPRWNVELLKIRNGKPGAWHIEWAAGRFRHIPQVALLPIEQQKKAG
jgi:protein ImuA